MGGKLLDLSLREICVGVGEGQISAEAVIEEAVGRHEIYGERIGAYRYFNADSARKAARSLDSMIAAGLQPGPLAGAPVSIKDIIGVRGMPIYAGMQKELDADFQKEGPIVQSLRRGGAIIIGKAHTAELAFSGTGTSIHWPAPRNPWDAESHRICGGSSTGAGVSLLEGSALLAIGTDTGGSVRLPASIAGTVGLKVTADRWSCEGIVPLSANFDTPGPVTRTVEDCIYAFLALDPILSRTGSDLLAEQKPVSSLRIAICDEQFWDDYADPGIREGVRVALDELESKGARIEHISFPEAPVAAALYASIVPVEGLSFAYLLHKDRIDSFDPNMRARMMLAREVSGVKYFTSLQEVRRLRKSAARRLAHFDALATPTSLLTPPVREQLADEEGYRNYNSRMARNTQAISMLGLCALSMPVALDAKSMPVGMQLVATGGSDERLLATAAACERALGTSRERLGTPPLLA